MREIINKQLKEYRDKDIALLFSGGLDSLSILLSCIDVGISPHLYTFRLEDYVSEDIKSSRKIKDIFNLEYTEVIIKKDVEQLKLDVKNIIEKFNKMHIHIDVIDTLFTEEAPQDCNVAVYYLGK